jgi:hypothetical protein
MRVRRAIKLGGIGAGRVKEDIINQDENLKMNVWQDILRNVSLRPGTAGVRRYRDGRYGFERFAVSERG